MNQNTQNTALLVIDFVAGITAMFQDTTEVIGNVAKAIAHARNQKIPVIYVVLGFRQGAPEISPNNKSFYTGKERFSGVDMNVFMKVHPELAPIEGELTVIKRRVSAFTGSDLEVVLRTLGVQHLVLTGISTSGTVLSTTREAADKDYRITVLSDGCADFDEEVHRVLTTKVFPRQADVLTVEKWRKYVLFMFLFLNCVLMTQAQNKVPPENNVVITSQAGETRVDTGDNGELHVNISPGDVLKFKAAGSVRYSDFGAKGDGKTDDIDIIAATHAFANLHGLLVKADDGAIYYIGGKERTAVIQTNTDFGTAAFIIDDTEVKNRNAPVFTVSSGLKPFKLKTIALLKRNQEKVDVSLPGPCLITVTNSNVKQYIRFGLNQNNGSSQTDIFVVDKNGKVDMKAPIIWDFEQITDITVLPIDQKLLKITGGRFTTIANKAESNYTYYNRNIAIRRSHVLVEGLQHRIQGEEDHGAPYGGFINIGDCAYVTVKNTVLTGHRTYSTIGAAGKPVTMGTYDLSVNRALNISFLNCSQTNDINDTKYWGILGSNFCKNLLYDGCTLSRFDAHQGVANATIRNSTLGHMGINAIGSGLLTIENSTVRGRSFVNLRPDYGSTWQGELVIRNCVFVPADGKPFTGSVISGSYSGQHNFGYTCYMPERITIENLRIDDSGHPGNYQGPAIFTNFNPEMTDSTYQEKFPYVKTKEVILKKVTTASGKALRVSDNSFMFKDVKVKNN